MIWSYRQRSVRMSGHQSRRALRRQEKARSSWSTVQQVMRRSERIVTGGTDQGTVCKTDCRLCLCKCRGRRVYNGCGIWRTQYYCREWDDPERSKAGLTNEMIVSEIDIFRLLSERRKNTTFQTTEERRLPKVVFHISMEETELTRDFAQTPFVPQNMAEREKRCEEILMIQAMGLKKRLVHTHSRTAVVGISGGLDSTLALLVTAKAFDMAGKDRKDIIAVTMPCFGTTDRTYQNACLMSKKLGVTLKEVPIADAVHVHFHDIGHDEAVHDVTYENSQARERTQVLMDIANQEWGMVIGTGDMSELALGGQLIMVIICPCMVSMHLFRRHWYAIWFSIMRIPVRIRS